MANAIKFAFRAELLTIKISDIRPLKQEPTPADRNRAKYKQIASTVTHIGLVEPLAVFPARNGKYLLVDRHKRLDVLKRNGVAEVECLISTEDEAYTYNRRVNFLPPVAEHFMILKAIANGVTEQRIVAIRQKRDLLNGICPEAADLLKTKRVRTTGFDSLRKMKPVRQIKCAQLMIWANNYSANFVRAFLTVTPDELLVKTPVTQAVCGHSERQEDSDRAGSAALVENLQKAEESYGADMLDLTTCCRYFARLLRNARIKRYLAKSHADVLAELEQLVASVEQESREMILAGKGKKGSAAGEDSGLSA